MNLFISLLWQNPVLFATVCLVVVFSVCCHEYMHARTALFFGDDTAARAGHLTLNPLRQMGVFSLVMLALVGLAWGQVPVDPANYRRRRDEVCVALAGPLTNFALAVLFIFLTAAAARTGVLPKALLMMLWMGGVYNVMLGVFNLLPVPGLDGWNAVRLLLPRLCRCDSEFAKGAYLTLILLIFVFFNTFWRFSERLAERLLLLFTGFLQL